jgi:Tol biopolymer transport system component
MFTKLLRSFRKSRRNRRSPLASRRLLAERLEDRNLLTTDLVSVAAFASANGWSGSPSISADGRYVAFASGASNLVAGDTNRATDVFVRDLQTETTTRVSVDGDGAQGNETSYAPSISADGRYVAFVSNARNLVAGDTNARGDVFVRDLQTNDTTRISVDSSGKQGNSNSGYPSISADGRYVAFESRADNLVADDTNRVLDVFARNLQTNTTTRVSLASDGTQGNGTSYAPSISADGRYVAFYSYASNLVNDDTNGELDVFVRNLQTGITTRVSLDDNGNEGNFPSREPSISADGRYVAFFSAAALVADDTNGIWDVFVRDLHSNTTTRVSLNSRGKEGQWYSEAPSISADGRYVAFHSYSKLSADDNNSVVDLFLRDLLTGTTTRLSWGDDENYVRTSTISADGRYVAFSLGDSDITFPEDKTDVYRVQRSVTVTAVTAASNPSRYGQSLPFTVSVSSDGLPVTEGTVTIQENGVALGQPVPLDFSGQASFSVSALSATASPHAVTAQYNGTAQFIPSSGTAEQVVGRAPLTVVADDRISVFDGQLFTGFTARYSGFVNGEDAITAGISGSPSFGGPAATAVEPGTYTIIPTVGTLAAGNYEFTTFVNGTLTILPVDFGDAPDSYRTLLASNGARHVLSNGLHLGVGVDADAEGQPGVEASDDAGDDGVTFTSVLRPGQTATVLVSASQAGGKLQAFLDFNADGDFSDPGEKIFDSVPLTAGDNELRFAVPADAVSATTYARFRISSVGGLSSFGPADDGEVEDYRVAIGLTAASAIRTDGRYQLDANNVTPGGVVVFCYGTQLGPNPSPSFGVTLGLTDPVYVAQGVADPTGHARALLEIPPALADQPVYSQVFEQGPNPRASVVRPLNAAALAAMPSGDAAETSGEFVPQLGPIVASDPRLDANRDGRVTPLDVLSLINYLNQRTVVHGGLDIAVFPPPSFDVNEDGDVTPLDVLSVINELNGLPSAAAEGEARGVESVSGSDVVPDGWFVGRMRLPIPSADGNLAAGRTLLPVARNEPGRCARPTDESSTAKPVGTGQATQRAALASESRRWNVDVASHTAIFSELDLPGSPLDAILSAIA